MPAPLAKSHPEVVAEIRRLAKNGKSRAQIIAAIKEKFNYNTTFTAVNDWAGVDFKPVGSGTPLSPEKIEEIKNLMSGDNPPTAKEAAKILGVGERSIHQYKDTVPYRTPKQWAEQYPDLESRLLSNDRDIVQKALASARKRQQRDIARGIAEAANKSRLEDPDFTSLTDDEAKEVARKKADHIVKGQKQRALLYRISPEPVPESFLSYPEYRKLQKSGADVPEILGRHYQGDFSKEGTAAMRQIVYDKVYPYLKAGGNPNTIDMHLGHLIAMKGVDPETNKRFVSGLTNRLNVAMQDIGFNKRQSNKVTKELLRGLGYHAPKLPGFLGLILGGVLAPWEKILADPLQEGVKYAAEVTTGLDVDKAIADPRRLRPSRIGATIAEDIIVPLGQMIAGGPPEVGANARGIPSGRFGPARRGLLDTEEPRKRRTNIWT